MTSTHGGGDRPSDKPAADPVSSPQGLAFTSPVTTVPPSLPAERIEEFIANFGRRSTTRIPLAGKLRLEHIAQLLKIEEFVEKNEIELKTLAIKSRDRLVAMVLGVVVIIIIAVLALSWMFFSYGRSDQVSNIINTLNVTCSAAGGGAGITAVAGRMARRPGAESPG